MTLKSSTFIYDIKKLNIYLWH